MKLVDGYGIPVRLTIRRRIGLAKLAKAVETVWSPTGGAGASQGGRSFRVDGLMFRFVKSAAGVGVLSVETPNHALPYHIICPTMKAARALAPQLVAQFREGKVPDRGVFRSYAAPVTRYPGTFKL